MTANVISTSAVLDELTDFQRVSAGLSLVCGSLCLIWGAFSHVGYARIWFGWLGQKGQSIVLVMVGVLFLGLAFSAAGPAYTAAYDAAAEKCRTWMQSAQSKRDSTAVLNMAPDSRLRHYYSRWSGMSDPSSCRELLP